MDILTQAGLSLTAIIIASNTLTNLLKFLIPEEHKFRTEFVRLMNFGFSLVITIVLVSIMDIPSGEVFGTILAIIGSMGSEKVHDANKPSVEEFYSEDI